jgi:F0F1-type ATP synthase assembly protein I
VAKDKRFYRRSNQELGDSLDQSAPAFFASYGMVGAIVLGGGLGFLLDRWLGTTPWLVIAGLAAGMCIGFVGLISSTRAH